jgi:hypothetical protein
VVIQPESWEADVDCNGKCDQETYPQNMERNIRKWADHVKVQRNLVLRHLGCRLFVLLFDVELCATVDAVSKPKAPHTLN